MEELAIEGLPGTEAPFDLHTVLACTECRARLSRSLDGFDCTACARSFPYRDGFIDLAPRGLRQAGLGQASMESQTVVRNYESRTRPLFLRAMGRNWGDVFTPADEDRYLQRHLTDVRGPALDLACGTGRWTRTIADVVGHDRTIALDLSRAMLAESRRALPDLTFVRGSAMDLPFADRSLGAINVSNALQLIPNPERVIQEVGRCLRGGGTFTCFTFRRASSTFYKPVQRAISRALSVQAFAEPELRRWIESAGMEIVDMSGPRLILLFAARRRTR